MVILQNLLSYKVQLRTYSDIFPSLCNVTIMERLPLRVVQIYIDCHLPKTVLAGTDSLLSQKETCERITVIMHGR